jgi:serine/threonine-protein kinase
VAIDALVAECLYKAAAARPSAANLAARLKAAATNVEGSSGLAQLASANREEVHRASVHAAAVSAAQTEAAQRRDLLTASQASWHRITTALQTAIEQVAPAAQITEQGSALGCTLGQGRLTMTAPSPIEESPRDIAFDVIAAASIDLTAQGSYAGRAHSVWFCDAVTKGEYSWFETAFMTNPVMRGHQPKEPFAMNPSDEAANALSPAMHSVQVAWPFTRLDIGDLGEFINRWGGWLGAAATGQLQHPSSMPERQPAGSWRRS